MWRFSDRGSSGGEFEDVLAQEIRQKNIRKAKGVKKNVIEKDTTHEHYKEALIERKQYVYVTLFAKTRHKKVQRFELSALQQTTNALP